MSPEKTPDSLHVKNRLLEKYRKAPRIDGKVDGAVKKYRKQYDELLKADAHFKDIPPIPAMKSVGTSCIKGKHPLLEDLSLTDKSVSSKHYPGFAVNVGDPDVMPAFSANELNGVNAVPGIICPEDDNKHKSAMSVGPHSASDSACLTDHGELDEDCEKDMVGWERAVQLTQ